MYTDRGRVTVDLILFRGMQSCELSRLLGAYSMLGPGLSSLLALTHFNAETVPMGKWEYFFFLIWTILKSLLSLLQYCFCFMFLGLCFLTMVHVGS